MPYIGNPIYQAAFVTDQFSGDGTTTAFTMSVAPAGTSNVLVVVSGVVQDPSTYGVVGTTLTFTGAPPSGTGNISCRYLGVPATGVTTTAYRTVTEFTATAAQTTFTPPSYDVGFINVYRNGVLLGSADYTATNGTTVVLATGATAGDLVTVESFLISSVANAISNTAGSVNSTNIADGAVGTAELASGAVDLTTKVTGVLPEANGGTGTTTGYYGFKNRLINGAMMIAQRSAGPVNNGGAGATLVYDAIDRFGYWAQNANVFSTQQSSVAPTGFKNSVLLTSLASTSITSGSYYAYAQRIEGLNTADLDWGTANAKTVTFSFWVRSSLTGTFNGYIFNSGYSYNYPFTYTISAANTWEQKTITIAGPTAGTWLTTNGIGIEIGLTLGAGSLYQATANAWTTTNYALGSSGTTNFVSTNGATLYTTGWQLEVGSTATSFDYLDYGRQLIQCQRYYFKPAEQYQDWCAFKYGSSAYSNIPLPTTMRASPTVVYTGDSTWYSAGSTYTYTNATSAGTVDYVRFNGVTSGGTSGYAGTFYPNFTASAEL